MTTRYWPHRPGEWVELKCTVKPPNTIMNMTPDREVREILHRQAEEIIARVEGSGWKHLTAPKIEFRGHIAHDLTSGKSRVTLHECTIELEVHGPRY